ncbi:MAG: hypothetical protein ACTSUK_07200 [Promethearchaeota archaeon]
MNDNNEEISIRINLSGELKEYFLKIKDFFGNQINTEVMRTIIKRYYFENFEKIEQTYLEKLKKLNNIKELVS